MGNQPSSGIPGGPSQHGGGDDPRNHGHGSMPPGAYTGYSGAGYSGVSPVGDAAYGVRGSVDNPHQREQQRPMERAQSDASMTLVDSDKSASVVTGSSPGVENWLDDDIVPTVFRWEHGGRQVYITGTFNNWSRQIPMHRSGNDFTYIHNLKREKHAFKFIVDDEWRFAPDQPTVADIEGRINNFIDVTDFKPYTGDREFEKEKAAAEYGYIGEENPPIGDATSGDESDDDIDLANRPDKDGEVFSQTMPDMDEYTKEPPPLPPHLRHIILNKPPQLQDTAALPVPQHVALNHLYCTAIKDNMMVLGITQRYKTKFVTTVYYSPCK
jgi:5'-AMP-activated protein kinase, regulatory beta subunit